MNSTAVSPSSRLGCTGDEHSPRFANTFENVFKAPSLQALDAGGILILHRQLLPQSP